MLSTSQEVLLDEETRDLPPDRLRRVLQDYETKTFFHMMGEARKERHEMERDRDREDEQAGLVKRGLSRRAHVRGTPTPSSASGQAKLNGTVMAESVTALDHVEEDTHNDCDTDDIDTNEDDDNDSDTDDNLSSILSASAHGENAKPLRHGQREDPAQDRLDEISCWMKSFDWKAHSKITDFVHHCWDLDNAKGPGARLFPSSDAIRSFLIRRITRFRAESRYFAKVFETELAERKKGSRKTQIRSNVQARPDTQGRIDRVLQYAGSYAGWNSQAKVNFLRWIYAQDVKAAKSGQISDVDAFKTLLGVVNFMSNHGPFKLDMRKTGRWDQYPPLKEMFDTWAESRRGFET